MLEKEVKELMGEKTRTNERQPTTTINTADLPGKNPVTFSAWQVLLIIYNIPSSNVVCVVLYR